MIKSIVRFLVRVHGLEATQETVHDGNNFFWCFGPSLDSLMIVPSGEDPFLGDFADGREHLWLRVMDIVQGNESCVKNLLSYVVHNLFPLTLFMIISICDYNRVCRQRVANLVGKFFTLI